MASSESRQGGRREYPLPEALAEVHAELSRKNEELQQAVAMLRAQYEATPDGVLIVDLIGRVLSYNANFLRIWAIPEALAARRDDKELIDFVLGRLKDPEAFVALVNHLYGHPLEARQEDTIEFKDGKILSRATVPVTRADGEPIARAWHFRDITAQRKLESDYRHAQKMEAVGTLAGGVAHDFNNLLTAIGGHIGLALAHLDALSPARQPLAVAARAVDRASDLTRALLSFSRQGPATPRPTDLRESIADVMNLLRQTINPIIEIDLRVDPDLWLVHADPGQMQQVLTNLCLNARDAMPQGGRLAIEAANGSDPSLPSVECVALRVSDTGSGMSPEVQARMFDPFFTTKEVGRGTGLGLATVYGIVQQHGGTIRCVSAPGRGTTFTVLLPRADLSAQGAPAETEAAARGGGETILVVDDEEMLLELEKQVLESYGYGVLTARDGVEAVEVFRRHAARVDLVVLDLLMPRRTGRDALMDIRAMAPAVPVILCTGCAGTPQTEELLALGPTSRLGKPFNTAALARKVRESLDAAGRTGAMAAEAT